MPNTQATVQGPMNAAPCAHCGQRMDLTQFDPHEDGEIKRGISIACDVCGRNSEIVDIRQMVLLRQA